MLQHPFNLWESASLCFVLAHFFILDLLPCITYLTVLLLSIFSSGMISLNQSNVELLTILKFWKQIHIRCLALASCLIIPLQFIDSPIKECINTRNRVSALIDSNQNICFMILATFGNNSLHIYCHWINALMHRYAFCR